MKKLLKYSVTMLIGGLIVFAIISSKDIANVSSLSEIYHILCDAFFAAGILIFNAGLLVFTCVNEGIFDGVVYGVSSFLNMFRRDMAKKYDTYYDYKMSRETKKLPFGFLIICGLIFLAVSFVMLFLYKQTN